MADVKFEEALQRLEEIVRKMESGDMALDESLKAFEEGMELSRLCMKKLDEAERTVERLLKEGDDIVTAPFVTEKDYE
ncbi:MAG: exodeoxyribonuclease VII small subunit [delta proteobacterium MLS_D]|jgi:exodeoxyribonuclease VII small subunit|nr:MAG: exodeoxyribonuclease VII small subunit [delta proteobacterium MLS_D]